MYGLPSSFWKDEVLDATSRSAVKLLVGFVEVRRRRTVAVSAEILYISLVPMPRGREPFTFRILPRGDLVS